jgi:cytochrome c-type biogenesis protein CcmF
MLSSFSYFFASKENTDTGWKKIARSAFYIHSAAVLCIVFTLFWMLMNNYFEYHYVWQHSNKEMPLRYIFSCFWEGQEGSFLLWAIWHVILGNILLKTSGKWESRVMTVFASVQVFLISMLLGIYIGDYNIGSNPFTVLLREHPDFVNAPVFQSADYLSKIDGRGLNPLLQNYWMTIHPPTLFLGFASTLVPFAFAIAGLWKREYTEWVKPALPWAFFGIGVLGIGILMGGAWAYEALSFGGFWAWDPVENASLVPWLTFVAAGHVMMINKSRNTSHFSLFFLTIITFLLILYSTFLTRSGVLGDTSVHAFTDLGLSGQLLIYLLFYVIAALTLLFFRIREFPKQDKEEAWLSREFWMMIGAIVLLISAVQIIFTTSIPVINKIFGSKLAPPVDAIDSYNAWQVPIAIIIALIMGFAQFLKFKKTDSSRFFKDILLPLILSVAIAVPVAWQMENKHILVFILLFASLFSVLGNIQFWIKTASGKITKAGSSFAHVGFGLILLGALISTSQKQTISSNTSGVDITQLGDDFQNHENILLFKEDTLRMGNYLVSYRGKETEGINVFYVIDYFENGKNGALQKAFTLRPRVQLNPRMGNVAEPDTRHFLHKDIYTHVTYAELEERKEDENGYKEPITHKLGIGDTVFSSSAIIVLDGFLKNMDAKQMGLNDSDLVVGASFRIITITGKEYRAEPVYILKDRSSVISMPQEVEELGLKFSFDKIIPHENKIEINLFEKKNNQREFIILKAVVFPYINILWIGCILMAIGIAIAVVERVKKNSQVANSQ